MASIARSVSTPFLLLLTLFVSLECADTRNATVDYRLPGNTVPQHYRLRFTINPIYRYFNGTTTITARVITAGTNTITLHSNVTVSAVTVTCGSSSEPLYASHVQSLDDTHFLKVTLKRNLVGDEFCEVRITYEAQYGTLEGLYDVQYYERFGGEIDSLRRMYVTQFAPGSARKAFPCYDEPNHKATFALEVETERSFIVLSNANRLSINSSDISNFNVSMFETTPRMSTYLVGFVSSQLSQKSLTFNGTKAFRLNARTEAINEVDYALDVGIKSLNKLEEYLKFAYALPKMDYVAVPEFQFNAMENWGMTTYREEVLLYDKAHTPSTVEQKIATVMSHENAHSWFGNEVTHSWWNYVWLKEGFATYFENHITDLIFEGKWRQMEQFVAGTMQETMLSDSLKYTNPMSSSVTTPLDMMANYNYVAYPKAGSVIRMMRHALGEEIFRNGLYNYIKSKSRGSATPEDLFESLQSAANDTEVLPPNVTVAMIFSTWSNQASYPLIYAKKMNNSNINIYQSRYYQDRSLETSEKWWIPLSVNTPSKLNFNDTSPYLWVSPNSNITVSLGLSDDWYILNAQQTGYFRVMYDDENYHKLADYLKTDNFEKIHPNSRAQLIDDSFELAKSGRLSYDTALDLSTYLENETDLIPWMSAQRALNFISGQAYYSRYPDRHLNFRRRLIEKLYKSLGFNYADSDDIVTRLKRNLAISVACGSGNTDCIKNMDELSKKIFKEPIHPDLRAPAYCNAIKFRFIPFMDMWNIIFNRTRRHPSERTIILNSLTCTLDPDEKLFLLEQSLTSYVYRQESTAIVIAVLKSDYVGLGVGMRFLMEHYVDLQTRANSPNTMGRVLEAIPNKINEEKDMLEFIRLIDTHRKSFTASEKLAAERAVQVVYANRRWREEGLPKVDFWLYKNVNSAEIGKCSLILLFVCNSILYVSKLL